MSLGKNLQALRKQNSVTQEELADELDVSRQTVSKWEQDSCYPEMEKLIALSKKFGVTMDDLLFRDLTGEQTEISPPPTQPSIPVSKELYEQKYRRFALLTALGVWLILAGVALFVLLQFSRLLKVTMIAIMLVCIAVAVVLIVVSAINRRSFFENADVSRIRYSPEERQKFLKKFSIAIAVGIALILIGLILFLFFSSFETLQIIFTALFLLCIATSCFLFVFYGIENHRFEYIRRKTGEISEEKSRREEVADTVCGCIMLGCTLVYLVLGFAFELWHPGWIVFPVGGIACAIVSLVAKAIK